MKDFLLNQLIQNGQSKSFTPAFDAYLDRLWSIKKHKNKRLTSNVFREPYQSKLFLKIYFGMRKKLRHGNQYYVATELINYFTKAKKEGLFEYTYAFEWTINPITHLYEKNPNLVENETVVKQQLANRNEFLKNICLTSRSYHDIFYDDVLMLYLTTSTPEAIVQMKKRLSRRFKSKKNINFTTK